MNDKNYKKQFRRYLLNTGTRQEIIQWYLLLNLVKKET